MTTRRRFAANFKSRVALEALRGDKTIQEIASKYKVHPNQVSTWKRQAMEGLGAVFSHGADKSSDEPGGAQGDDPARPVWTQFEPSM